MSAALLMGGPKRTPSLVTPSHDASHTLDNDEGFNIIIGMRDRMIQVSGRPFQSDDMWPPRSVERIILQRMRESPDVYSYESMDELAFELRVRKNIIASAKAMNYSGVQFEPFSRSRCNPRYWQLTSVGGFRLKPGVPPADAIEDIYRNGFLYAFECATAILIIYYHAVLNSIDRRLFNQLFQHLYLYSWHADPDLDIQSIESDYFLPGDVVYFNNPDFHPSASWWRGENAVVLENGAFFAHGIGIRSASQIIMGLNRRRRPGSTQPAHLMGIVTRPSFKHLSRLSTLTRNEPSHKNQPAAIHHNISSIPSYQHLFYLNQT